MFPQELLTNLAESAANALATLNDILATSDRDAQRVAAALGILRLTERVFSKLPLPEGGGRGVGGVGSQSAPSPPPTARRNQQRHRKVRPPSAPSPTPTRPTPSAIPHPTSDIPTPRPLDQYEIEELNHHFTIEPARLRDPTLIDYWRNRLLDARESILRDADPAYDTCPPSPSG